jgi:hypothetical protein
MDKLLKRLDEVVKSEEKRSKYDYDYIMKSLVLEEKKEKEKREKLRQFKKASQLWKTKVETAKRLKEEIIKDQQERILTRMSEKFEKSEKSKIRSDRNISFRYNDLSDGNINIKKYTKSLDNINQSYSDHSRSHSLTNLKSEKSMAMFDHDHARINVEKSQMAYEEKRLKLQKEIEKKLKKLSNKNLAYKKGIKEKYKEKLSKHSQVFENYKIKENHKNNLFMIKEQADIERFRNYQIYLQNQRKKFENLKKKEKQKSESIYENLTENNRLIEEKRKKLENRLMSDKKRIRKSATHHRLVSILSKESIGMDRVKSNHKVIDDKLEKKKSHVLEKELTAIKKSNLREESVDMCKHNSQ